MLVVGSVTARLAHLQFTDLFIPYFSTAFAVTFLCALGFVFIEVAKLARIRADDPIPTVWIKLKPRLPLLALPGIALPLFLIGFTTAKSAIPFLVGYTWDAFWADTDRLIFREDVWELTQGLIGTSTLWFWQWFYTVGWGAALFFSAGAVTLYARPRTVAIFFTAMFATWFFGGWLMAYCFSAAGPVFAHLFEPSLGDRFEPLRHALAANLGDGAIGETQAYLQSAAYSHIVLKGGGISAMPSMHLGAVSIYVLGARGTKWLLPAIVFWAIIFTGSAYFGYHYWVDGIVAAAVAWLCWGLSARALTAEAHSSDWSSRLSAAERLSGDGI
jgi:hypothetical protein